MKKKSLITINFNQFFKQRTETAVNRFYCFKDDEDDDETSQIEPIFYKKRLMRHHHRRHKKMKETIYV